MSFDLWTLGFQAVNVLVLVWLLQRFFWRPIAGMIAARQAGAQALIHGAEVQAAEAEAALADIAATRAGLVDERAALLEAARVEAGTAGAALLETAREQAEALQERAGAARVRAAERLKADAVADAQGLAVTIAQRLLARLDVVSTEAAFLGWLAGGLADLPEAERGRLAGAALDVVSATEADSAARARITQAVAGALGSPPDLRFRTDPGLIAGLELHSPHFTLRNSWRADLDRIAAALAKEDARPDAA